MKAESRPHSRLDIQPPSGSALRTLECPVCGRRFSPVQLNTYCHDCQSPLLARYDLAAVAERLDRDKIGRRSGGMWRWRELLPLFDAACRFSLGEGATPLLPLDRLGSTYGFNHLALKDEGVNPTGTFKARGLAMAVSKGIELGATGFVIPTAGNAGGALAAYAARAGVPAHVYMPQDAPPIHPLEVEAAGGTLHLVDGLIDEAGRQAAAASESHGWFNVATFREPYRVEGKKTMGFELAKAYDWSLPDVVVYPTGGGTGLVGMWKAFDELEELGWIDGGRPRMVSVQASGCAPVVRGIESGAERIEPWEDAHTHASGLRVPSVFADRLVLVAIRQSGGTAVAVSEAAIEQAERELAAVEGILACPEGAATWAGVLELHAQGWLNPDDRIVLFNTGSGLKYLEA
jgi:threonine synthase